MDIIERPSPNHDERPPDAPIDLLLLHYTGMPTAEDAFARLVDAEAKVSAHYVVDEDGAVYRLVAEARRAWHAGVSYWAGRRDINARSIGIEIVNPGHEFGYRAFPPAQMRAVAALCQDVLSRHRIPRHRVLGHSDVAPRRKTDPGELFDWGALAGDGIGLWPWPEYADEVETIDVGPETGIAAIRRLQDDLTRFGYDCPATGRYDRQTVAVVRAFQRHWRPAYITGVSDAETLAILAHLLDRVALTS